MQRFAARLCAFATIVICAAFAPSSVSAQSSLTSDREDYTPGSVAVLTGAGFGASESVTLQVVHADGSPATGDDHQPWSVSTDESGGFVTTWQVCESECGCVGQLLTANASGVSSGSLGSTTFANHVCGNGVVTSVTPVGGACSAFTPAVGSGPDNYEVQEGGTYVMTISGVTECTGSTITVFVQSSSSGNFCFNATGGGGTYSGTFTMPSPACNTMPVSYKCGADATCSHPNSYGAQGPTSGCGGVHLRASNFNGSCVKTGTDTDCGGCTPCTLVCPPDVTIDCSESIDPSNTGSPTGCAGATYTDDVDAGNCAGNYVITRTWTADNGCQGTVSCEQEITVTDTTGPDIDCPAEVGIDCSESTDPSNTGSPTATDDCSGVANVSHSDSVAPGNCAGNYVITRTWTATDNCGNSSSCDQTITVSDTTGPDIDCPADAGVDCSDSTDPADTGEPTATDDCSGVASIGHSDSVAPGNCAGNYVITRTWTATDNCGNSSSCDQTITVTDTTPPTIECPPDVTLSACCVTGGIGEATGEDDCSNVTITNDAPAQFCVGETVVTWTATDDCGNSDSCQQIVTVEDVTLDFEFDGAGAGLLHGQSLVTPGPEVAWTCVTISSGPDTVVPGDGNNGAAIFNSTSGPFGQDPDLGVGQGNVLHLQRNGSPTSDFTGVNGVDTWDHPNDDEDGGTLTFDFCSEIEALELDLIDIDLGSPPQDSDVTLTDSALKTRVYTVPAGWTANGGVGTLSLTATGVQVGDSSNATEVTQAGYDGTKVIKIVVRLGSSGAIDNLHYCPGLQKASATPRNGSGLNTVTLTPVTMPVLGSTWLADLDCSNFDGVSIVSVRRKPAVGAMTSAGEVLIAGDVVHRVTHVHARSVSRIGWEIPDDLSLAGVRVYAQGQCRGQPITTGPKGVKSGGGLSNAVDLILGF